MFFKVTKQSANNFSWQLNQIVYTKKRFHCKCSFEKSSYEFKLVFIDILALTANFLLTPPCSITNVLDGSLPRHMIILLRFEAVSLFLHRNCVLLFIDHHLLRNKTRKVCSVEQ